MPARHNGGKRERGRGSSVSEREAIYRRLLDLPEETEELSEEGVRALREAIEDFKNGNTSTREEIKREFGA